MIHWDKENLVILHKLELLAQLPQGHSNCIFPNSKKYSAWDLFTNERYKGHLSKATLPNIQYLCLTHYIIPVNGVAVFFVFCYLFFVVFLPWFPIKVKGSAAFISQYFSLSSMIHKPLNLFSYLDICSFWFSMVSSSSWVLLRSMVMKKTDQPSDHQKKIPPSDPFTSSYAVRSVNISFQHTSQYYQEKYKQEIKNVKNNR